MYTTLGCRDCGGLGASPVSVTLSTIALIGATYQVIYSAEAGAMLPSNVASDFLGGLRARTGIQVTNVQLNGRVMNVTFKAKVSASLLSLIGGGLYTGDGTRSSVWWTPVNAFALPASTSSSGGSGILDVLLHPIKTGEKIGDSIKDDINNSLPHLPNAGDVGAGIGNAFAAALKPLVPVLVAGTVAYMVINHKRAR